MALKTHFQLSYRKPYPDFNDQVCELLLKRLSLTTFLGEDTTSTEEHITRFIFQLGLYDNLKAYRLRFFPYSLHHTTFTWYINLLVNSTLNWLNREIIFHKQFGLVTPDITISDLARIAQLPEESSNTLRIKQVKNRYNTNILEDELAWLAFNDLKYKIKSILWGTSTSIYSLGNLRITL